MKRVKKVVALSVLLSILLASIVGQAYAAGKGHLTTASANNPTYSGGTDAFNSIYEGGN